MESCKPSVQGQEDRCERHGVLLVALTIPLHNKEIVCRASCQKCEEEAAQAQQHAEYRKRQERAHVPHRYLEVGLKNFAVSMHQQVEVLEAVKRFIDSPNSRGTGLLMLGNVGTGKTMLACAIINTLLKGNPQETAWYLTTLQAVRSIRASWRKGADITERAAVAALVRPHVLVLDEMGASFGSDAERVLLTEVVNERYNTCRPTIMIGNLTIEEFKKVAGGRIADRFREGKLLIFDWPSFRGRVRSGSNLSC